MGKNKEKMFGFKVFKTILGGLFKLYYNPTIIGEENVPEEGAIIVVGNHVHIMDQCLPIMGIKRPIHYMAKKEYFDNKKVAWFFKLAGCIPVDRSIKDTNATGKAMEVLENDQALGLFPEGTRNGLKEQRMNEIYDICKEKYLDKKEFIKVMKKQKASYVNYLEELMNNEVISKEEFISNIYNVNDFLLELVKDGRIKKNEYDEHLLLPFKFGAVSMAKKTGALLVPFGITGEYKFRSKDLVVRIGKPIRVDDDLAVANKELSEAIAKLMRQNLKK
ncbi:MAG: 1-acyl-sn-glycerol-3-phosphate acyltransferase [Bacilli bacterium]|nr:1-acyl-sn-glycerol-3-phosphate acyltransferase [Bacilli bacterium]